MMFLGQVEPRPRLHSAVAQDAWVYQVCVALTVRWLGQRGQDIARQSIFVLCVWFIGAIAAEDGDVFFLRQRHTPDDRRCVCAGLELHTQATAHAYSRADCYSKKHRWPSVLHFSSYTPPLPHLSSVASKQTHSLELQKTKHKEPSASQERHSETPEPAPVSSVGRHSLILANETDSTT